MDNSIPIPTSSPLTPEQREKIRKNREAAQRKLALSEQRRREGQISQTSMEQDNVIDIFEGLEASNGHSTDSNSSSQSGSPEPKRMRRLRRVKTIDSSSSSSDDEEKDKETEPERRGQGKSCRQLSFSSDDSDDDKVSDDPSKEENDGSYDSPSSSLAKSPADYEEESDGTGSNSVNSLTTGEFTPTDPWLVHHLASIKSPKKRKSKNKGKKLRKKRSKEKITEGNETTESENDDDFSLELQHLSIHKINLLHPKLQSEMEKAKEEPESKVIQYIVSLYNEGQVGRNKEPKEESGGSDNEDYIEGKLNEYEKADCAADKMPKMKKFDKAIFPEEEEFSVKLFFQKVEKANRIFSAFGARQVKTVVVHKLIFYYRSCEIFALTTGSAWVPVQWCSDYSFLGKVAARILNRAGTLSGSKKGLVGTLFKSTRINKEIQEDDPFDLLSYRTEFRTSLEEKASLLKLHCFMKKVEPANENDDSRALQRLDQESGNEEAPQPGPSKPLPRSPLKRKIRTPHRMPTVHVMQSAIRIEKRFSARDLPAVLMHLSVISRGMKTFSLSGEEEKDSSAHRQYLQQVSIEKRKELDLDLSKVLHSAIADDQRMCLLEGSEILHKKSEDYFSAQSFMLLHKSLSSGKAEWNHPPSIQEIVQALRQIPDLAEINRDVSDEKYLSRLAKCKLQYAKDTAYAECGRPEQLLNCFQIMWTLREDNNVYWRVAANWFHVDPSYVLLVQESFIQVLRDHLRDSPEDFGLHLGNSEPLHYKMQTDAFVPDTNEMMDILKLDKNGNLTIYFTFNDRGSSRCMLDSVRITQALLHLRKGTMSSTSKKNKAVGGTEHNLQSLEDLYEEVKEKNAFKRKFKKFSQFKGALQAAEVVVICPAQDGLKPLKEELSTPTRIKVEDIQKALARDLETQDELVHELGVDTEEEVAIIILKQLKSHDLLTKDGDITSRLVTLTSLATIPFIGELRDFKGWIYEQLVLPLQPDPESFMGKLQLILVKKRVAHFGLQEKFHILEI